MVRIIQGVVLAVVVLLANTVPVVAAGTPNQNARCIAENVTAQAGPGFGSEVSTLAHDMKPLGRIVGQIEARHDNCLEG